MSDYQPTKPYVYQPDPVNSPDYPRIYALAGPGIPKEYQGKRYTKAEAEDALAALESSDSYDMEAPDE